MSPELFDPEIFGLKDSRPTKHSDRYALGMLIYEVLSGQIPFFRHHGYAVIVRILKGERPERPQGVNGKWLTNEVWGILERCWKSTPRDRPKIKDVLECLNNASRSWTPPSPRTVVSPPATCSPVRTLDSSFQGCTDESEISSPPQGVSSHPSREHPRGDLNGNHI